MPTLRVDRRLSGDSETQKPASGRWRTTAPESGQRGPQADFRPALLSWFNIRIARQAMQDASLRLNRVSPRAVLTGDQAAEIQAASAYLANTRWHMSMLFGTPLRWAVRCNAILREMKQRDFAQYSTIFGLDGLEIMSARWVKHSFAPHMHDFYAVSLNYGGRGAFHCRHALRDAVPGTCNLIAPGELHTGYATSGEGWAYRNLYIDSPLMTTLVRDLDWKRPLEVRFKLPLVDDHVLARRLARAFASLHESNSLLQNESLLLSVVACLAADHFVPGHSLTEPGREPAAVRRIREWLDAHPEQNISLHSLASTVGLSPYYLVRAFHKHVGIPPHQYQKNIRVLKARKLLASGTVISEVAYRAGFCDQSHLNRCFKTTLGVTPGKYATCVSRRTTRQYRS